MDGYVLGPQGFSSDHPQRRVEGGCSPATVPADAPIMEKRERDQPVSLHAIFFFLFLLAVANFPVGAASLRTFLSRTPAMATHQDLDGYKVLVRKQMYQALLQIVLLVGALGVGVVGLATRQLSLFPVLAVNGGINVGGLAGKRLEERARSVPVRDPSLSDEYRRVSASWLTRPLPDFWSPTVWRLVLVLPPGETAGCPPSGTRSSPPVSWLTAGTDDAQ